MERGARPWPNPADVAAFEAALHVPQELRQPTSQNELPFMEAANADQGMPTPPAMRVERPEAAPTLASNLAAELFLKVRELIFRILTSPMDERDIGTALQLTEAQTREWLERLVLEGIVRRLPRSRYEIAVERPYGLLAADSDR